MQETGICSGTEHPLPAWEGNWRGHEHRQGRMISIIQILCASHLKILEHFTKFSGGFCCSGVYQRSCFGLSCPHLKCRGCCRRSRPFWRSPLNHLLFLLFCAGRKGGHKGRARQYTSPEEIDAQLQAEKQKARVCVCPFVCFCPDSCLIQPGYSLFRSNGSLANAADHSSSGHSVDPKYLQLGGLQGVTQSAS